MSSALSNNQIASMLDTVTLEAYNLCFIASKLLTVDDHAAILIPADAILAHVP